MLTRNQCKAARALVDVTAARLADAANVSPDTLRSFESGRTKFLSAENQAAVTRALEAAGVEFIPENGGGAGVRLRKQDG